MLDKDDTKLGLITELAEKAAPIKEEVISKFNPRAGSFKKDFVTHAICAVEGVKNLKEIPKEELPAIKKAISGEYNKVRDYIFDTGDDEAEVMGKLEKAVAAIAVAVKWLPFLGKESLLNRWTREYGLDIRVTAPSDANTVIVKDPELRDETAEFLANTIDDAVEVQNEIKEAEERILVDMFEELPDDVRYSQENKRGIKKTQFASIVSVKALKNIEEEKASKKAASMADKAMDAIAVNQMVFNIIEPDSVGA